MSLGFGFGDPLLEEMEKTMDRVINRAFGNYMTPFNAPLLLEEPGAARPTSRTGRHGQQQLALTTPNTALAFPAVHMPMDLVETGTQYELHADAPGMTPEDIKVELHEGVLTVRGERKVEREDKDKEGKVWRSERSSYAFCRSFTLPENVNADGLTANVDNGVLVVTMPKKPEAPAAPKVVPKRIKIGTEKQAEKK